jgi:hypothetical protein
MPLLGALTFTALIMVKESTATPTNVSEIIEHLLSPSWADFNCSLEVNLTSIPHAIKGDSEKKCALMNISGLGDVDIHFINLRSRTERLERILKQFRTLNLSQSRVTRIEGATYLSPEKDYYKNRDSCRRSHLTALRNWVRLGLVRFKRSAEKLKMPGEHNLDMFVESEWPRLLAKWWRPAGKYQDHLNGSLGPTADLGDYMLAQQGDWGRAEEKPGKLGRHFGATGFLTASAFGSAWEGELRWTLGRKRQKLRNLSSSEAFELLMDRSHVLLVLEDDTHFWESRSLVDLRLEAFFSNYGCNLDGLQLWYTGQSEKKKFQKDLPHWCKQCSKGNQDCFKLHRQLPLSSTSAYMVTRSFAEKLLVIYEDPQTAYYDKSGARGAGDVVWRAMGKTARWFTLKWPLVIPTASKSSIRDGAFWGLR